MILFAHHENFSFYFLLVFVVGEFFIDIDGLDDNFFGFFLNNDKFADVDLHGLKGLLFHTRSRMNRILPIVAWVGFCRHWGSRHIYFRNVGIQILWAGWGGSTHPLVVSLSVLCFVWNRIYRHWPICMDMPPAQNQKLMEYSRVHVLSRGLCKLLYNCLEIIFFGCEHSSSTSIIFYLNQFFDFISIIFKGLLTFRTVKI